MKRILITILILAMGGICFGQGTPVHPYIHSMWRDIIAEPNAHFQPAADSTTFFQVKDKDGNNEFTVDTINNALLFGYTKLGTTEGSYNFINGSAFGSKSGYTYCVAVGNDIANSATGNVYYNNLVGSDLANSATGSVATGGVTYNNLVGYSLANSATGAVHRNNLVGSSLANSATGNVTYNNLVGYLLASSAEGSVTNTTLYGSNIANAITGSIDSSFAVGPLNLYNTTNETDLARVIALPYEALRESSASNLDDAIAIGYRAGYQNAYNSPALFGREATADANNQMVLGSSFYTGGLRLYGADFKASSTTPYFTLHNSTHEDTDGGRESRLNFKGEQSGGEETTLARMEVHHDGAADDQKGKLVISTNDGADDDTPTTALTIDSTQTVTGKLRSSDGVSGTLVLDDGTTERITLVFTGGILTSRTVEATVGALIDWTD